MKSYSYNASMRKWNLGINDPYTIILAADQRMSDVDYSNHQIWKLDLGQSEPPSIKLSTTFGFRAQNLSIFPQFSENYVTRIDPVDFLKTPQIEFFAPNLTSLNFEPFLGISVNMDIFVPDSQTITGKFKIRNSGGKKRELVFDLVALLNPDTEGQTIQPIKKEISAVLSGKTGDLYPVLFITGGAEGTGSPYPSLRHKISLESGEIREFTWAMASLKDQNESFDHARKTTTKHWAAESQKIKMLSRSVIDVKTGDLGWDASFAFAQNIARPLLIPKTDHLSKPSFVQALHPDFGYSSTADGSDYGHLWNGQSVFDVWQMLKILLPSEVELIKGFMLNFLNIQKEDGFVDGKPGPVKQRQNQLAAPLLSQIAFEIYKINEDRTFLENIYESLLAFFFRWFTSSTQSGELDIPVWNNIVQGDFEINPAFSHLELSGQGADIRYAVSPDLLTLLYQESLALQKISSAIEKNTSSLENYQQHLRDWLTLSWNQNAGKFCYLDIASLKSQTGKIVFSTKENGSHQVDFASPTAIRFMLQINKKGGRTTNLKIQIKAQDHNKKPVTINILSRDLHLILDRGTFTIPNLLTSISSVRISSLPNSGMLKIKQVDLQQTDHNSFLPIVTGILSSSEIGTMINKQLFGKNPLVKKNGVPALSKPLKSFEDNLRSVWLSQNQMIIKGLYDNGHEKEAAEIFSGLMNNISLNLKRNKSFHRFYHAEQDSVSGESNIISGLPPLSLFIHLLGLKIFSPRKIGIHGFNSFSNPVEINFKGLQITSFSDHIKIKFPDGNEKIILDPKPCIVETSPS